MNDEFQYVIIKTFIHIGGNSKHHIRAHPLPGQGFPTSMLVECSSSMRASHPVGTIFKVRARIKNTDQEPHLYTSWQWAYETLKTEEAEEFIARKKLGSRASIYLKKHNK